MREYCFFPKGRDKYVYTLRRKASKKKKKDGKYMTKRGWCQSEAQIRSRHEGKTLKIQGQFRRKETGVSLGPYLRNSVEMVNQGSFFSDCFSLVGKECFQAIV